ncbi:MAG TPA: DNA topoisomerase I [Candidatus Norongarragalinales archaeon]|nr:DNA topoisomerase I [Candidatus Norongarragalinales archaeon]
MVKAAKSASKPSTKPATKQTVQLIISEKPKTAQKIAAALSPNYKTSNLHGVNYYEFEKDGMKVYVAPAVGHVYTLAQKEKGSGYPVFDIEWKASSEVSDSSDFTRKYLQVLQKLGKEATELVSATDYDIEGSLIAGNIINHMGKGKSAKRMLFSTLTEEDLREAYASAGMLDVSAIEAGEARHIMDFYWGINCSRALMHALRSAGRFKVLSIGRVQGPALAILAHKEKEIAKFKPEKYFEIHAHARKTDFLHEKGRFFDAREADAVYSECSAEKSGVVERVESRKFRQLQPVPFDLTTMQVEAYRNFGMSPTRTLQIAQSLYEGAYISYPRTSSQKLPEKLGLRKIIEQVGKNAAYSKFASLLISQNRLVPHEGEKTDSAHVSIYPTGQIAQKLSPEEGKLYDLIVRRFLSTFAPEAKRESMKVTLKISSHNFVADGTRTIEEGWFAFYKPYLHLEEIILPDFKQGERVAIERVEKLEKETQPPRRYTPASIIRELERQNLGTKATRSVVVDTLYNRSYLTDKKSIKVTSFGMAIYEALSENVPEIINETLTREFEESVEKIEKGQRKGSEVVEEGRKVLLKILEEFKLNEEKVGKGLLKGHDIAQKNASVLGKCNLCKVGDLQIRKSRYGFFVGCSSYPNCRNIFPLPRNALIEPKNTLCKVCGIPEIKVIRKGKRPFEMCLNPKCESKASWGKKDFKKGEWKKKDAKAPGPEQTS